MKINVDKVASVERMLIVAVEMCCLWMLRVEMQLALATGQEDSVMRESCNAWSVVLCAMVGTFI